MQLLEANRWVKLLVIFSIVLALTPYITQAQDGGFPVPTVSTEGANLKVAEVSYTRDAGYDQFLSLYIDLLSPGLSTPITFLVYDKTFNEFSRQDSSYTGTFPAELISNEDLHAAIIAQGVTSNPFAYSLNSGTWQVRFRYTLAKSECVVYDLFDCARYTVETTRIFRTAYVDYDSSYHGFVVDPGDEDFYSSDLPLILSSSFNYSDRQLILAINPQIDSPDHYEVLLQNTPPAEIIDADSAGPAVLRVDVPDDVGDVLQFTVRIRVDGGTSGKEITLADGTSTYDVAANEYAFSLWTPPLYIRTDDPFAQTVPNVSESAYGTIFDPAPNIIVYEAVGDFAKLAGIADENGDYDESLLTVLFFLVALVAAVIVVLIGASIGRGFNASVAFLASFVFFGIFSILGYMVGGIPTYLAALPLLIIGFAGIQTLRAKGVTGGL